MNLTTVRAFGQGMSSEAPAFDRKPQVTLPSAPRRAVLQSISAQDSVPVQRQTSATTMGAAKLPDPAVVSDAVTAAQGRVYGLSLIQI